MSEPVKAPNDIEYSAEQQRGWKEFFANGAGHPRTLVRAHHHYAFRPGEWAWVLGTKVFQPADKTLPARLCYVVLFRDNTTDHIPLMSTDEYQLEFTEVS